MERNIGMDKNTAYTEEEIRFQYESNELYRLLHTESGPQGIINRAEELLERAVVLLDASYSMLAASPMLRESTLGLVSSEDGTFLNPREVESLRRLQIENEIYRHTQAFCTSTADHPDTNWIFCAVRIRHIMSGYVAVRLPNRAEATEHELRLTTVLADVCSVEMQKHDYILSRSDLGYETFFSDLIEGRYHNLSMVESRFRMLHHRLGLFFCLALLDFTDPQNISLFHERQIGILRKSYPDSLSIVYKNNIVFLFNQDQPILFTPEQMSPLKQFAIRNQLKVGVSQPFADILKTGIYYEQAMRALQSANPNDPQDCMFYSTETLPDFLFSNCSYEELETSIHFHIFYLQNQDRIYHTEYIPTLRAYLEHNRNTAEAAESLHIHRTTLFYRLKKIEELLSIDLTDGHLLFLYELSFKIWDYLSR